MTMNKVETIGILICIGVMSVALFIMRTEAGSSLFSRVDGGSQLASVTTPEQDRTKELESDLRGSINSKGEIIKMVIDDVVVGEGATVKNGDTISVHYIGTLKDGTEFDNSHKRGDAFEFVVGEGMVIKGWEEGVLGMKKGGQRLLVIPSDMAYGANAIGPIPANSTLIFSIELLEIK
jgi:FKBP-type peptidyl-prolyl cis-trans isomerase